MPKKKRIIKKTAAQAPKQQPLSWPVIAVGLLALAVLAFILLRGGAAAGEISVSQAYEKYQDGVFLLDVREQYEWDEAHIPNTTLIPLGQLAQRVNELPKDQEIVVVCRSGNRSQQGRDTLVQAGFENVSSMAGGIRQWTASGYPIEP